MPSLEIPGAAAVILVVASLAATPVRANDTTIPCASPPEKGASVAVHPSSQVSKTQDVPNGTCTFSINGAVATSPPAEQVMRALNLFRDKHLTYLEDNDVAVQSTAALLAAATPLPEVSESLVADLRRVAPLLQTCLKEFFLKRVPTRQAAVGDRFTCMSLEPYLDEKSKDQMLAEGRAAVGEPTLQLTVKWQGDKFISTLYLPIEIVGMPAL